MSQWAHDHPEEMAEIAALPYRQQNDAMRGAVGYDPDRIRARADEPVYVSLHDALPSRDSTIELMRVCRMLARDLAEEQLAGSPPEGWLGKAADEFYEKLFDAAAGCEVQVP